jgi:crossover junction endodeoxyribonuclease RusA
MLTKRARQYRGDVVSAIRAASGFPSMPPTARLRLEVELRAPDCRQRDLDNHLKGLQDALMHAGVLPDDSQIDELVMRRGKNLKDGAALVMLTELEAEP